jgi:hypothetical protein
MEDGGRGGGGGEEEEKIWKWKVGSGEGRKKT